MGGMNSRERFLILNDKRYLPDIVQKIIADAKGEAERAERAARATRIGIRRRRIGLTKSRALSFQICGWDSFLLVP